MLARVRSTTLLGIEAVPLTVECDLSQGLPGIHTVGLPDAAVRESAERVRAALRNTGHKIPSRRITISLAPADLRKEGAALDLPIALGILGAAGEVPAARMRDLLVLGELGLDGTVRPVPGCLPAALVARRLGIKGMIVPAANGAEAMAVPGPDIYGVAHLRQAAAVLRGDQAPAPVTHDHLQEVEEAVIPDLNEVRGQAHAKRALEVAAAGGHHLLMVGPPGCGKTMLARRLPGILPPLALEEAIEITCIYSAASLLLGTSLMRRRPFRAPHHTVSGVGLVGGGRVPRPGEVTLAHHGVLFLDEIAEFGRATLDVLRQPLEDGSIVISRANRSSRLPARFTLVGAMNPCPCGQLGRSDRPCACTPAMVAAYRARLSGPLFDRFDMQVELAPLSVEELREEGTGEPTEKVAARVAAARERQGARLREAGCRTNAALPPRELRRLVRLDDGALRILTLAVRRLALSARAHDGILRVARTIADLEGAEAIDAHHIAEAVQYRTLDRDRGQIFTS